MIPCWLVAIVVAPLLAAVIAVAGRSGRVAEYANLAASAVCVTGALWLVAHADGPRTFVAGYVILDALAAWTLVCTCAVYCLASIYAIGYMRLLKDEAARLPGFYALFALFAATMICGPLMNNVGVYWIAIELTTLVSTFLVGFEHGQEERKNQEEVRGAPIDGWLLHQQVVDDKRQHRLGKQRDADEHQNQRRFSQDAEHHGTARPDAAVRTA